MDRLDTLELFTRIVATGSFTQAAGAMGIPRATASHAIKALEARLGARLLERSTRHVRPTLDGQAYHERCLRVLAELRDAESALRPVGQPRGHLRVDMHGTHATHVVLPALPDFHARYPDIALTVSTGDRLVDLLREGVDCVVRAGTPRDPGLVARRLALMPQVLCASPAYLARAGTPTHPDALASHQMVRFFAASGASDYPLVLTIDGAERRFAPSGWIAVDDAESYVACGLAGAGLIQLPAFHIAHALEQGHLVPLLAAWPSPPMPLSVMYPYHRQMAPRVRVFVDWLVQRYAEVFGPAPADPITT